MAQHDAAAGDELVVARVDLMGVDSLPASRAAAGPGLRRAALRCSHEADRVGRIVAAGHAAGPRSTVVCISGPGARRSARRRVVAGARP